MSMPVLEQKLILLSTLFLSFAIMLKQNKIHKSRNKMQYAFGEGGGVEFGLTETCFPSLSSRQKHKPKIGSQ